MNLLRRRAVERKIDRGHSFIYDEMKCGRFPRPVLLGPGRAVGWIEAEVDRWIEDRIADRDLAEKRRARRL